MTLVVPFDGSPLAEAALVRATEFGAVFDEPVLAISVIPKDNTAYARERGWLAEDEPFDLETVVGRLHEQVTDLCPSADFRHEVVDRYAPSGTIAKPLRAAAKERDASMVFIGSDNAGSIVTTLSSVGATVATDENYDVVIVRHRLPAKVERLREVSPFPREKSDFYLPQPA